jgi:hypothetical protein
MGSVESNRTLLLLALCVLLVFVALPTYAADAHCGPRCVHQILAHYGQTVDLIDLVREIQYPELNKPAQLDKLQASLESRNIHTVAIKTKWCTVVRWQYPVIVHALTSGGDGHYVTLFSEHPIPGEEAGYSRTGVYLLTSPNPISELAIREAVRDYSIWVWVGGMFLAAIATWGITHLRSAKRLAIVSAFALTLSNSCGLEQTNAQESDASELNATFQFVMAGVQAERESLVTGVFDAEAHLVPIEGPSYDSKIFCAFDHAAGKLRFDRTKTLRGDPTAKPTGGYYIVTPENVTFRQLGSEVAAITAVHNQFRITEPFDVRILGLAYWPNLQKNTTFASLYDTYMDPRRKVTELTRGGDLYRIIWVYQSRSRRREIVVDASKGYWPIRFSLSSREDQAVDKWNPPDMESDLSLQKVGETWVPSSFLMKNQGDELNMTFHWKSVNAPVPPETFTYEGLDLEGVARVIDNRLGQPVVVKNFVDPLTAVPTRVVESRPRTRILIWLGAGTLVLVVVFLVLLRSNRIRKD